jgi:hypothetical protein
VLIVGDCALGRGIGVSADIDADDAAPARAGKIAHEGIDADAVEAEAVDERIRFGQAKEPRRRVSRLRARRDGAKLDEAEAKARERIDVRRVLVESRRETDGIGKVESHCAHGEGGHARKDKAREEKPCAVRGFGV